MSRNCKKSRRSSFFSPPISVWIVWNVFSVKLGLGYTQWFNAIQFILAIGELRRHTTWHWEEDDCRLLLTFNPFSQVVLHDIRSYLGLPSMGVLCIIRWLKFMNKAERIDNIAFQNCVTHSSHWTLGYV